MSEVEGCTFDASGPVVAIDLESAGSCDYQSPDVDCKAQATVYGRYVNFLNPPDQIVWTVTGATIISGQGSWTLVVETDSFQDTSFQVQLQCIDSISNDNDIAIRTYTNLHNDITDTVAFIGPDIVVPTLEQNAEMEAIDVTASFNGNVTAWELIGGWPAGVSIQAGIISGATTDFGNYTGLQVRAIGTNNADSNLISFDVTEEAFVENQVFHEPLAGLTPPIEITKQWPFIINNDFLLCAKFVVPTAPSSGNKYAVYYKWQNTDRALRFQFIDTGVFRMFFQYGAGLSRTIDANVNPTPGTTIEVKWFKSATQGIIAWINNVKQTTTHPTITDPLDELLIDTFDIGHFNGGSFLGTAMSCVSIYSGDMTEAQIEGITICQNDVPPPDVDLPWMEDYDTGVAPSTPPAGTSDYSKLTHPKTYYIEGGLPEVSPREGLLKYSIINVEATSFYVGDDLAAAGHEFLHRGITHPIEMEWLQKNSKPCGQGWGNPFTGSTPDGGGLVDSSGYGVVHPGGNAGQCNGGIPARWWLYLAGTTLSEDIDSLQTVFTIADGTKVDVNEYAVIRNVLSATDWSGSEHVKVTNVSGNTITVVRGYYSDLRSHPAGSYIAQHHVGDNGNQFWSYNLTSQCPVDTNGLTFAQWMAQWVFDNQNDDINNNPVPIFNFIGFGYDVDRDEYWGDNPDCDNDGITDGGYGFNGEEWWIEGLDQYYSTLRALDPTLVQVGGTTFSPGYKLNGLNGTQLESMLTGFGAGSSYQYSNLSSFMSDYSFRERRGRTGPVLNHCLYKQSTAIYETFENGGVNNTRLNSPYRMTMGAIMMYEGAMHQQYKTLTSAQLALYTQPDGDICYDEYIVNLNPAHLTLAYGQSPLKGNQSDCAVAKGWLGQPLTDCQRLYDRAIFDEANDLLNGAGKMDTGIAGWTSQNTNISHNVDQLEASSQLAYNRNIYGTKIISPSFSVDGNSQEYTVCFEIKSDPTPRRIKVKCGSHLSARILVDDTYKKYVMTYRPSTNAAANLEFQVGSQNTRVHIKNVYVFKGSADMFIREFENGIVCVNMTNSDQTFDLGSGSYQRILGSNALEGGPQDPINDGSPVGNNLIVAERDSAILVRQQP